MYHVEHSLELNDLCVSCVGGLWIFCFVHVILLIRITSDLLEFEHQAFLVYATVCSIIRHATRIIGIIQIGHTARRTDRAHQKKP